MFGDYVIQVVVGAELQIHQVDFHFTVFDKHAMFYHFTS